MVPKYNFNYKRFLKVKGYGSLGTSKLIFQLLQNKKIREFHESNIDKSPLEYLNKLIDRLNIKLEIDTADIKNIPEKGSFVVIANHPFVGLDGLLLLHVFLKKRPDFKLLATNIAQNISPLNELFFPIIRSEGEETFFSGIKNAFRYIKEGNAPQTKVKLIASSWSNNWRKGFDIYRFLDENLDFSKYEMTFVGNSPVKFKNIKQIPPVESRDLAELLRTHHIYITASQNDPCSNSLIEALSCVICIIIPIWSIKMSPLKTIYRS